MDVHHAEAVTVIHDKVSAARYVVPVQPLSEIEYNDLNKFLAHSNAFTFAKKGDSKSITPHCRLITSDRS